MTNICRLKLTQSLFVKLVPRMYSRSLARPNSRLVFVVDVYIFVFKVYSIRKLALWCPETIFYEKMLILRDASFKSTLSTNLPNLPSIEIMYLRSKNYYIAWFLPVCCVFTFNVKKSSSLWTYFFVINHGLDFAV